MLLAQHGICCQLIDILLAGNPYAEMKTALRSVCCAPWIVILLSKMLVRVGQISPRYLKVVIPMGIVLSNMEYLKTQLKKMLYPQGLWQSTSIACGGAYNN